MLRVKDVIMKPSGIAALAYLACWAAAGPSHAVAAERSPPDRREALVNKADARREARENEKAADQARVEAAELRRRCAAAKDSRPPCPRPPAASPPSR